MSSTAAVSPLRRPDVEVTDRPILMAAPMVRATLRDEKRQTRRIVKFFQDEALGVGTLCPYGAPGDRLVVKEASWIWCERRPNGKTKTGRAKYLYVPVGRHVVYCADGEKPTAPIDDEPVRLWRWKSGRFMPRWASRITLAVESVRVERLRDITEEDARAEGVTSPDVEQSPCLKCGGAGPFSCVCRGTGHHLDSAICPQCLGERLHTALGAGLGVMEVDCTDCDTYRKRFRNLWNHINGAEAWAANPWVWVIGFSRVTP